MTSRKARTVCHDEECRIHCRQQKECLMKSCQMHSEKKQKYSENKTAKPGIN